MAVEHVRLHPRQLPDPDALAGNGRTNGVGHLGAWGGVLIAGALFSVADPRNFILWITIPCALLPGALIAIFGKRQRGRASKNWPSKPGRQTLGRLAG